MKGYEKYKIEPEINTINTHFSQFKNDIVIFPASEKKSTLLLIETNKELLNYLSNYFSVDYFVIPVSNGLDALKIARNKNPSLIISAISIPGMNGFEICRQIKSSLKLCHIPLIFLSSKNTIDQKIKGYEVGADDIIAKPIDINLLAAKVNRLIQNRILIKEKYLTQNFMVETEENTSSKGEQFLKTVKATLKANLADPDFNVQKLSEKMQISTTQLYRNLKEITGYTPVGFIRILRLQHACFLLKRRDISVSETCYQSGFNNVSYFIKCFKKMFGETPASFMNNSFKKRGELTWTLGENLNNSKYKIYKGVR